MTSLNTGPLREMLWAGIAMVFMAAVFFALVVLIGYQNFGFSSTTASFTAVALVISGLSARVGVKILLYRRDLQLRMMDEEK